MRFLLSLLIVLALTVSNGAALAAATCRHVDADAHAAARQSADAATAAAAATEESAAISIDNKGALADAAAVSLSSFILPSNEVEFPPRLRNPVKNAVADAPPLSSRSLRPLLEPPLA